MCHRGIVDDVDEVGQDGLSHLVGKRSPFAVQLLKILCGVFRTFIHLGGDGENVILWEAAKQVSTLCFVYKLTIDQFSYLKHSISCAGLPNQGGYDHCFYQYRNAPENFAYSTTIHGKFHYSQHIQNMCEDEYDKSKLLLKFPETALVHCE